MVPHGLFLVLGYQGLGLQGREKGEALVGPERQGSAKSSSYTWGWGSEGQEAQVLNARDTPRLSSWGLQGKRPGGALSEAGLWILLEARLASRLASARQWGTKGLAGPAPRNTQPRWQHRQGDRPPSPGLQQTALGTEEALATGFPA